MMIKLKNILNEAKTVRYYIRHPLDVTKAVRVLKAAGIPAAVGIGNILQIDGKDVESAVDVLTANRVDFEATKKQFKLEYVKPTFSRDRYEKLAREFYKKTGMDAPGKDRPAAAGMPGYNEEERKKAWKDFLVSKGYVFEAVAPCWK